MIKTDAWSRRTAHALVAVFLAAMVTGCGGGGGNAGTPVIGVPAPGSSAPTGGTPTAADLVVVLSKSTMTNSGTDSITATVTSINADRVAVGGVPVSFSIDPKEKAVITPAGTTTDAKTGVQTATITQGDDASVRPVTVTVTAGSITRSVAFNVVQDSSPTNPQASDLSLTLSATNIDNSGSRTVVATATAVDSNRRALQGIPVQLSVADTSAFIVAPSNQTNDNGQVTGTVGIGQDRSNRQVTVTATSGTLTRTVAFQITGAQFSQATAVPSVVAAGAAGTVQYTLTDVNGNPIAGVPISVSGTGITSATSTTNLNGGYLFQFTAPNAPGTNLKIDATAGGVSSSVTIPIPGGSSGSVPVATAPVAKTLNLSSDVVSVNTGSTSNQVNISAFFRDANNAPIPNVRVLFGVSGDNQTGSIGSGTNTVLSDASGTASTNYVPGAVSSPTNGVTISACWKTSDFAASDTAANCAAAGGQLLTTTLTIVSNPVSITIGTDNKISTGASGLTYVKKYAVLVVDSAGNPKADVQITPSVDLGGYGKGFWTWNAIAKSWVKTLAATCPNEDLNRNGVIDSGEDINANKQLDPRKSDLAVTLVGATKTDSNGVAVLQLEYPQSIASWVKYKITVTAAGVLSPPAYYPMGTPVALPSLALSALPSVDDYLSSYIWMPVPSDVLTTEVPPPPFASSPYGSVADCTSAK